ncbi:hypothetical protein ACIQ9E_26770 [Streptomyces sp. NPDC094448]|uniref:hypothetical protein n=1 Tax=Streptomyces sp. NPDC094448 TaxID=3366063 RepID=UPI0038065CC6
MIPPARNRRTGSGTAPPQGTPAGDGERAGVGRGSAENSAVRGENSAVRDAAGRLGPGAPVPAAGGTRSSPYNTTPPTNHTHIHTQHATTRPEPPAPAAGGTRSPHTTTRPLPRSRPRRGPAPGARVARPGPAGQRRTVRARFLPDATLPVLTVVPKTPAAAARSAGRAAARRLARTGRAHVGGVLELRVLGAPAGAAALAGAAERAAVRAVTAAFPPPAPHRRTDP